MSIVSTTTQDSDNDEATLWTRGWTSDGISTYNTIIKTLLKIRNDDNKKLLKQPL